MKYSCLLLLPLLGTGAALASHRPPAYPVSAIVVDDFRAQPVAGRPLAEILEPTRMAYYDNTLSLLDALAAQGLPLGVITTVPRGYDLDDLRALLTDPEILDRFDVVLMSSQAESRPKPDPAIYAEALALLPSPPPISSAPSRV